MSTMCKAEYLLIIRKLQDRGLVNYKGDKLQLTNDGYREALLLLIKYTYLEIQESTHL